MPSMGPLLTGNKRCAIMKKHLLSCDWGTSSFRLRLVETDDGRVLGERLLPSGVAATFDAWKSQQRQTGVERDAFFYQFLTTQIEWLSDFLSTPLTQVPMALSGMASSTIGLAEVPYATLPFSLDGGQVSVRWFDTQPGFDHRLLLISGVRSRQDVMRGEETQLIGLSDQLAPFDRCVLVFPGTHSKHMYVARNELIDFQTLMTGELFGVLAQHTILKESTDATELGSRLTAEGDAFRKGVQASESANLLGSLFTVRTNQLFNQLTRPQNALYLSGLLIGTELRLLQQKPDWHIVLCCDNNLVDFYEQAITHLGLSKRTTRIEADRIRHSAIAGHLKIMQHQSTLTATVR